MKKLKLLLPVFALLLAFSSYGCFGVDNDFKHVRNGVLKFIKAEDVDREIEYSVSNFGVYTLQKFASLYDGTYNIELLLSKISNVQIGVYDINSRHENVRRSIKDITKYFNEKGWLHLVKNVEGDECSLVFVNIVNNEEIKEVFIVNAEKDELILLRVRGKLHQLADLIIKNRGTHKKSFAIK